MLVEFVNMNSMGFCKDFENLSSIWEVVTIFFCNVITFSQITPVDIFTLIFLHFKQEWLFFDIDNFQTYHGVSCVFFFFLNFWVDFLFMWFFFSRLGCLKIFLQPQSLSFIFTVWYPRRQKGLYIGVFIEKYILNDLIILFYFRVPPPPLLTKRSSIWCVTADFCINLFLFLYISNSYTVHVISFLVLLIVAKMLYHMFERSFFFPLDLFEFLKKLEFC